MAIRIKRNEAGNCIEFQGSSNPVYWNACLSGEVDSSDTTKVNVINDIKTAQSGATQYEFFRIPFSDFADEDGVAFASAQEVSDYVTLKGNVSAPEDINVGYKGVFDASVGVVPNGEAPVNGDWYYIGTEGTIGGVLYRVNDIIKYSETSTSWEKIENKNATVTELENSALDQYNIHVDADYTGTIRNGTALHPYSDLATAITNSSANDSILVKGVNIITSEIVLPHSLSFYGANGAEVKYANFDVTNGDIFSFTGDMTQKFIFKDITFKNAGGYALYIKKTDIVEIRNCKFFNNGWNGLALNTYLPEIISGLLGYDSSSADLQAFYAGANASNGGAIRIQECTKPLLRESRAENNLRGFRLQDCGINGGGFVIENQSLNNIESGIYLAAGSLGGCQNVTVTVNYSSYNANNGLLCIGGINNKFSQNEVNGNWNAGMCAWGSTNLTLRDSGLYDNNRSEFNGIGNTGDAKASIQINDAYSFIATQITWNTNARFIAEILDTQVHYTGLGSNTEKIGFLMTSGMGSIPDNEKNIIKIDDVGFIGQDYAIDLSEVDITNLRLSLGDNSYQSIGVKAVKAPLQGNYSELPFSNHVMQVPEVDVVVDTLKQTLSLREGVGGNVINTYDVNELSSVLKPNSVDIIINQSDKIQLRDCTLGNTYINGVVAGSNINTLNDSLNAAFSMNLTQYKDFLETEVGVNVGDTATFYYIESPDGTYHYPLFKTEAEANLVDTELTGSGTSHTHTYVDDLTNTTWYMPDVSNHMSSSVLPVNGLYTAPNGEIIENVIWNIQTTDDDANYAATFNSITYNVQEGSSINIPYKLAGDTATYNLTNVPNGYADDGYSITGTAEDITNGYGQSIQHVINVTKVPSGDFASAQGTITINVLADLAGSEFTIVEQASGIRFTQDNGNTVLDFNTVTFNAGSTYKFYLDAPTVEANDTLMIVDSGGNAYTTGVTLYGTVGSVGAYLEFAIPSDVPPVSMVWSTLDDVASVNVPMTVAGSTYSVSPTGVDLEGPAANQTGTVIVPANGYGKHGWISLDETLAAGQRLILNNAFFTDLLSYANGNGGYSDYEFAIGLKGDNWVNTQKTTGSNSAASGIFKGDAYLSVRIFSSNQVRIKAYANGNASNEMLINAAQWGDACAFIEITGSGNNVRIGFGRNGESAITAGDESTVRYGNWSSYKAQTGEQGYGITQLDVMFLAYNSWGATSEFDTAEIDWTELSEIAIPVAAASSTTPYSKAVDFGSSTNAWSKMVSNNSGWPTLRMNGWASGVSANSFDAAKTSNSSTAFPWLTSVVFQPVASGPSAGGRIWSVGGGHQSSDYNITLHQKGNDIYFYWGYVSGSFIEFRVLENVDPTKWYGVYIAHKGGRDSSASNTDLAEWFDIRVMSSDDNFASVSSDLSTASEWGQSYNTDSGDMTQNVNGTAVIGGINGQNINAFYGKVASVVMHGLLRDVSLPDATEIKLIMTDPKKWETDYLVGTTQYRYADGTHTYATGNYSSGLSTMVWLMGDGTSDSYANGIRCMTNPSDQNYAKMQLNNMQNSAIVNVNISGLS